MDLSTLQPLTPKIDINEVHPGDTVRVAVQIKEGEKTRVQSFQGVVIKKGGYASSLSFTVRRVFQGIGVERSFLVNSPLLVSVEILRRGAVRRGKLFYLRGLSTRKARIKEGSRILPSSKAPVASTAATDAAPAAPAAETPAAE